MGRICESAKMSSISYCIPVHVLYQQVFYYLSLCTINSALQYKTGSSWSVQKLFPLNNNKGAKETKFLFNSIWIWINEVWFCEKSLLLSEARKDFLRSSIKSQHSLSTNKCCIILIQQEIFIHCYAWLVSVICC